MLMEHIFLNDKKKQWFKKNCRHRHSWNPYPPSRRQTSAIGTPLPPYIGNGDTPPPLKNADILNGWSLKNIQAAAYNGARTVDAIPNIYMEKTEAYGWMTHVFIDFYPNSRQNLFCILGITFYLEIMNNNRITKDMLSLFNFSKHPIAYRRLHFDIPTF